MLVSLHSFGGPGGIETTSEKHSVHINNKFRINICMSNLNHIYTAGLFDGEGSFILLGVMF